METHNIISTPDITGNIGSCTTKAERIITYSGWFKDYGQTITTNSCTGQVQTFDYQNLQLFNSVIATGILIIAIFIGLGIAFSINE